MRGWHNGRFDDELEAELAADEAAIDGYAEAMAEDAERHALERDLHQTALAIISDDLPPTTVARLQQRRADAMARLEELRAERGRPCLRH